MQSIDSIDTYVHGTSQVLVREKEEMNFDDVTKENIREHIRNWPQIPDHPHRILITGGSVSGKTNSLFNPIINLIIIEYANDMDDNSKNTEEYNPKNPATINRI